MKLIKGIIGAVALVLLDQATKLWAVGALAGGRDMVLWDGVFRFQYLENTGAAFGIFQGQAWFSVILLILTAALLILVGFFYRRIPDTRRFWPLKAVCVLLAAGAAGNLIDRICRRYVVDFLYFELIRFPIFNVADCYVVISAIALFFLFLFRYQEADLKELGLGEKEKRGDKEGERHEP